MLWTSIVEYLEMPRPEWIQKFPGQAVLNGSQLHWTKEIEEGVRAIGLQGVKDVRAYCADVGAGEGVSMGVRVPWELQMCRFRGGGWCVGSAKRPSFCGCATRVSRAETQPPPPLPLAPMPDVPCRTTKSSWASWRTW